MLNLQYKPSYVWPNKAFPFRTYFEHENLRIFLIENISHNWEWMRDFSRKFQARDHFLVYCGWYHSDHFVKKDTEFFEALCLDKNKFFFLFNSENELQRYRKEGFQGALINHNAWLDWNGPMQIIPNAEKLYSAIYVARATPFKRHHLAGNIKNLALITGENHGGIELSALPSHVYRNEAQLDPTEVCAKINQSVVGLILSEEEGACFASSEYLLCGIPVVSTPSRGGRDFWFNSYNSIVADPEPAAIEEAVNTLIREPRDPYRIRRDHIELSVTCRDRFINTLGGMFQRNSISLDPAKYFEDTFIHKLRNSESPRFEKIWP